jgi:protein-disulfide isomerase
VKQLGVKVTVLKVEDINEILSYNIMSTPVLVVNGKIKTVGRVPSIDEIKRFINDEITKEGKI